MTMLPMMDSEFVERRKWLTKEEMIDIIAVVQSLPGAIACNMAVLIGYRVKGVVGALVAVASSIIMPIIAICVIAYFLSSLKVSPAIEHIFLGVRAGTAALIAVSLIKLARGVLKDAFTWCLCVLSFIAAVVLKIDITYIIVASLIIGIVLIVVNGVKSYKGK